jgi:hypothetical protein
METEKILCLASLVIASLVALIFLLDLTLGIFSRVLVLDILFLIGAAFVIWQGVETYRELK